MAQLDEKTIAYLTQLSRIHCSDEEKKDLLANLKKILTYMEQLNEIDTTNVAACNHVLKGMVNVMREDAVKDTLPRSEALGIAPAQVSGLYKVPPVLKQPSK